MSTTLHAVTRVLGTATSVPNVLLSHCETAVPLNDDPRVADF